MSLLHADELLSSPVVANATMNRGRGLSGITVIDSWYAHREGTLGQNVVHEGSPFRPQDAFPSE